MPKCTVNANFDVDEKTIFVDFVLDTEDFPLPRVGDQLCFNRGPFQLIVETVEYRFETDASKRIIVWADVDPMTNTRHLADVESVRDCLAKFPAITCLNVSQEVDIEDEAEDEIITDPGNFDGGYGEGSYYDHAMGKD